MVAPNGTVNDAIFLFTPILSITVLNVTGIVAFDDDVENAKSDAATQWPLQKLSELLESIKKIHQAISWLIAQRYKKLN